MLGWSGIDSAFTPYSLYAIRFFFFFFIYLLSPSDISARSVHAGKSASEWVRLRRHDYLKKVHSQSLNGVVLEEATAEHRQTDRPHEIDMANSAKRTDGSERNAGLRVSPHGLTG